MQVSLLIGNQRTMGIGLVLSSPHQTKIRHLTLLLGTCLHDDFMVLATSGICKRGAKLLMSCHGEFIYLVDFFGKYTFKPFN